MLQNLSLWDSPSEAKAQVTLSSGTVVDVDKAEFVMECDPSLRTMPLWEADLRFDREKSDSVSSLKTGDFVCVGIGTCGERVFLNNWTIIMHYCYCAMIVTALEIDESDCVKIIARDARIAFDKTVSSFTSNYAQDPILKAITESGLPITVTTVTGQTDGLHYPVSIGDSPVSLSAIALDESRVTWSYRQTEISQGIRLGGAPTALYPVLSKTAVTDLALVKTSIIGDLLRDAVTVPDAAVIEFPKTRSVRDVNEVTAVIPLSGRSLSSTVKMGDSIVPVSVTVSTRTFGGTDGLLSEDEVVGNFAGKISAILSMPEYRCRLIGNPNVEIGDRLTIPSEEGTSKTYRVIRHTLSYDGGLTSDLRLLDDFDYKIIDGLSLPTAMRRYEDGFREVKLIEVAPSDYCLISFNDGNFEWEDGEPPNARHVARGVICGRFPKGITVFKAQGSAYQVECDESYSNTSISLTAEDFS